MTKRTHVIIELDPTDKQWEALSREIDQALVGKVAFSTSYEQAK